MKAAEIARLVGGVLEGDETCEVTGLASLAEAGPGDISFLANPRYGPLMAKTRASVVLVAESWKGPCPRTIIRVPDPDRAFALVTELLGPKPVFRPPGIHPSAVIASGTEMGPEVHIGPFVVVEPGAKIGRRSVVCAFCYIGHDTVIGEECLLYPHVTIRERCRVGNRTIIHSGAVIGSDGFGYFEHEGVWKKIPQVGIVEIGDDCEIGANVTVDRARFGRTVIGNGVKLDNLIQVGHNVKIGDHTAMAAQVGIAGSTVIGRHVQVGGQAGIGNHVTVGDGAAVAARAAVHKDVPTDTVVAGIPAMKRDEWQKLNLHLLRLPLLAEKVRKLAERLEKLEKSQDSLGKAMP
ncbi:MAG: UDP-3-O-(3-hydroxymyristoyl)glucosamine N-acyltransferase [Kiritimatiellae bacterium]|nr:UDP-3-O-(3-hydroxymyristoyl)glucosamine N-acyltransferase [Kiritimatiellia bacterium]